MNQERWGTKAIRVLLACPVLRGQEGNQDHWVKLVMWGHKDHLGLQGQRDFLVTSEYQGPMVHLDQRVCRVTEGPKAHQGQKEYRVMKDHLAHLAALALLGDLGGKAILVNLDPRV